MRVIVNDWEAAILFRDGRYVGPLAPGPHVFLSLFQRVEVKRLPRQQWVQETAVEAVSADRFPLRMSVGAVCEVTDAKAAFDADYLVRAKLALSAAVSQAAATVTLDDLMVGRAALGGAVQALILNAAPGCALTAAQVVSITLPPEVRRLYTEVERARRESEAALQRAQGEHASLRSLANAARLLKGNPELMNLRLLQAVGSGPRAATVVLGSGALSPISATIPPSSP